MSAKVIQVIESQIERGDGKENCFRQVTQYYDFDGNLLAENDPCAIPKRMTDIAFWSEMLMPLHCAIYEGRLDLPPAAKVALEDALAEAVANCTGACGGPEDE